MPMKTAAGPATTAPASSTPLRHPRDQRDASRDLNRHVHRDVHRDEPPGDPDYEHWVREELQLSLADPAPNLTQAQMIVNAEALIHDIARRRFVASLHC